MHNGCCCGSRLVTPPADVFKVLTYGHSADDCKERALAEARKFFGAGPALRVVPGYDARPNPSFGSKGEYRYTDMEYSADMTVQAVTC